MHEIEPIKRIDKPVLCECLCGAQDEIADGVPAPKCWLCGRQMIVYRRRTE